MFAERPLGHHAGDQAFFGVRTIGRHAVGVKIHTERVVNRVNVDFLVETVFRHVIGVDAPVAPAHADSVFKRGVVGGIGVGIDFNVAGDALDHFGNFQVAFIVDGVNLDAGALLALLVGDLAHIGVDLVDGQTGARFQVAAVLNLHWPLVATGKLQVAQRFSAVLRISFGNQSQKLNRITDAAIHVSVLQSHMYPLCPGLSHPSPAHRNRFGLADFGGFFNHQSDIPECVGAVRILVMQRAATELARVGVNLITVMSQTV